MKICHFCPLFWPEKGGIETITLHIVQGLRQRGHEVMVITTHGRLTLPNVAHYEDIPIYRFPMLEALSHNNPRLILTIQRQIAQLKREFEPDVVHLHVGGPVPVGLFHLNSHRAYPTPCVMTLHDPWPAATNTSQSLMGQLFNHCRWVIADSQAIWQDALATMPSLEPRLVLLYCALPTPTRLPEPLPFNPPRLLSWGRLEVDKGFDVAIEALARLGGAFPELTLTIAGDGAARPELEQQAISLGGRVHFTGRVPDLIPLLNQSTLVLVPSRRREAFGLVALEAAQMARPVIATPSGGLAEIVLPGKTGLLTPVNDSQAFAEAIASLLTQPDLARQMGQTAYHQAHIRFNYDQYLTAHEELYASALQSA